VATLKILYIGLPTTLLGGAEKRSFNTLRYYPFYVEVYLYIPITYLTYYYDILFSDREREILLEQLEFLRKHGIVINDNIIEFLEGPEKTLRIISNARNLHTLRRLMIFKNSPTITILKDIIKYEKDFIKEFLNDIQRINIIYSSLGESIYILSSGLYAKHLMPSAVHITLLHQALYTITQRLDPEPLRSLKLLGSGLLEKVRLTFSPSIQKLLTWFSYKLNIPLDYEGLYKWSAKRKLLDAIFAVSREPLNYIDFNKIEVPIYILRPGNAFDSNILNFRNTRSKKDYAVYYARLIPEKGILEIPLIWYLVSKFRPTNLIIVGRFFDKKTFSSFRKLLETFMVKDHIIYMGFLHNKEELYRLIANAKVLVYPSHSDGFSLVVLESLALGTSVVAYNIPALRDIYGSLPPVKLAEEGDIKNMAATTIKILDKDIEDYIEEHEKPEVNRFIELHSGWEKVAETEIDSFRKILTKNRG